MAFTSADLEALETAIKSDTLRVSINGREIVYKNTDEMMRAYDLARRQIVSSSRSQFRRVVFKNA